jgi:septal ring factor EnvC (AmiA/AmiB activator)
MQEVKRLIEEIGDKVANLQGKLQAAELENERLQEQVSTMIFKLNQRETELKDLEQKLDAMEQSIKPSSAGNRDMEIDALVREIDECIMRLKQG